MQKCEEEWSYQEVRRLAVLTTEEMQHFEETIARLAAVEYCEFKTVSFNNTQTDFCINSAAVCR